MTEVEDYENQVVRIGHDGRTVSIEDGELVLKVPVVHGTLELWFTCEEQRDLVDALRYFGAIQ